MTGEGQTLLTKSCTLPVALPDAVEVTATVTAVSSAALSIRHTSAVPSLSPATKSVDEKKICGKTEDETVASHNINVNT